MAVRACRVTCRDSQGIEHSVDVTAQSLYEAVAQALRVFREDDWTESPERGPSTIVVRIKQGGFKPLKVPGTDGYSSAGKFFFNVYDLQNNHASIGFHGGSDMPANSEAKPMYNEFVRYSTPSGLVEVLK